MMLGRFLGLYFWVPKRLLVTAEIFTGRSLLAGRVGSGQGADPTRSDPVRSENPLTRLDTTRPARLSAPLDPTRVDPRGFGNVLIRPGP